MFLEKLVSKKGNNMQQLYLYTRNNPDEADHNQGVQAYLEDGGVAFEVIDADDEEIKASLEEWTAGIDNPFPMLRIGEKIRANLFRPSTALLERVFPEAGNGTGDVPDPADLEMFTTGWCPDCIIMERALRRNGVEVTKVNADSEPGAMENIMRWSGGRRTVPSFQWGQSARMFHPGVDLLLKLVTPVKAVS